jgi:hypothetical protein
MLPIVPILGGVIVVAGALSQGIGIGRTAKKLLD